jgi:hypothetical protein
MLPFNPLPSQNSPPFQLHHRNVYTFLIHVKYVTCPARFASLDFIKVIFGEYLKLLIVQLFPALFYVKVFTSAR